MWNIFGQISSRTLTSARPAARVSAIASSNKASVDPTKIVRGAIPLKSAKTGDARGVSLGRFPRYCSAKNCMTSRLRIGSRCALRIAPVAVRCHGHISPGREEKRAGWLLQAQFFQSYEQRHGQARSRAIAGDRDLPRIETESRRNLYPLTESSRACGNGNSGARLFSSSPRAPPHSRDAGGSSAASIASATMASWPTVGAVPTSVDHVNCWPP